uniref:DNA polymerase delta subunit 2 n=1 Tax=Aceria tosichella TaxID=561515 RepID=A0A6G1SJL6_9ACAR
MARVQCSYKPENGRFILECDFSKQYHHYYRKRLEKIRPFLQSNSRKKWDPAIPICTLSEVASCDSDTCIVIGTIFKRMKLQPSVIDELSKGNFDISSERYLGHYTSQDDTLTLEDHEESVQLVGKIDPKKFVTGVTVALLGSLTDDGGRFLVDDVCFAEPSHHGFLDSTSSLSSRHSDKEASTEPVYLLVVSSLGFHHEMSKKSKLTRSLQDMIDFIWGGGKFSEDARSSRVARVLVVGDSLHADRFSSLDEESNETDKDEITRKIKQSRQVKPYSESVQATKHMDDFFAQLSKTIDVDVIPGQTDPSTHLLPQQPFHPCMFPKSSIFPTFNCTTNPHHAIYNDVEILATAGQNIDIISKFSGISDPIEIMKCHLQWGNSAPSAPDNLYSVPYEDEDPFIIESTPNIYIAGCQESFNVDFYEQNGAKTLLLTIPEFHKTLNCVLVDLESMKPQLLSFE